MLKVTVKDLDKDHWNQTSKVNSNYLFVSIVIWSLITHKYMTKVEDEDWNIQANYSYSFRCSSHFSRVVLYSNLSNTLI